MEGGRGVKNNLNWRGKGYVNNFDSGEHDISQCGSGGGGGDDGVFPSVDNKKLALPSIVSKYCICQKV